MIAPLSVIIFKIYLENNIYIYTMGCIRVFVCQETVDMGIVCVTMVTLLMERSGVVDEVNKMFP